MKYLPALMASLREQTFRDFSVLVIDNASSDGAIDFLRTHYPEVVVLRNFNNLGFAGAHNQGIRYALANWRHGSPDERYVLVTNPDIILTPHFLRELIREADAMRDVAAFGGKLLKVTRTGEGPLEETVTSSVLDTTGIRITRSRRTADRGAGEEDRGQYDDARDVFGISGALALYRARALEAVQIGEEYFDEHFFAYKEDADLAWRLQLAGFGARYVPEALAYHFRTAAGREVAGFLEQLRNRRTKSRLVNFYSYRNHLWMLVKNERVENFVRHVPWIGAYELAKFFSILFFEPATLRASFAFWRELPQMLVKRRAVMAKARVSAHEMNRWFT